MMINDLKYGLVLTLPKKNGTIKCEKHKTIKTTSHASKIICWVIKTRLESKIDLNLRNDKFGFKKNIDTREAILSLRNLIKKPKKKTGK